MYAHLHTPPPPLTDFAPETPAPLAQAIMSCLEKDKTKRPGSAKDLAQGLGIS
jgi:hypothetical protein